MQICPKQKSLLSLSIYHHHHYFFTLVSRCFFSALTSFLICTFINLAGGEQSSLPADPPCALGLAASHVESCSGPPSITGKHFFNLQRASLNGIIGWPVQFGLLSYLRLQVKGADCSEVHLPSTPGELFGFSRAPSQHPIYSCDKEVSN